MEYLKIKDEIDLKELEKFGFKKEWKDHYTCYRGLTEIEISSSRAISVIQHPKREYIPNDILLILYDLFKADLIEKVVEG